MQPSYDSTPQPAGTRLATIAGWSVRLSQLHQRLRSSFARPEPYQLALRYLQAVLSQIPRKNGWQIAEHARQLRPYGMQRLLSRAVWDQDGVRDELRALVQATLQPPAVLPDPAEPHELFPVLALDESSIPKRGKH